MGPKMSIIFVRYSREFVITVIGITKFDCISYAKKQLLLYGIILDSRGRKGGGYFAAPKTTASRAVKNIDFDK